MKTFVSLLFVLALFAGMLAAPQPAYASASAAAACGDTYTVVKGDYLTKIAKACGVTYDSLLKANPEIKNPNLIYVGQVIRIKSGASLPNVPGVPTTGTQEYIVVKGDTLSKIAANIGSTLTELLRLNPEIKDASKIYVGQKIRVPANAVLSLVRLSSTSLRPGDAVDVTVRGFPANADIDFRLGVDGKAFSVVLDGKTNDKGEASARMTIPTTAVAGEKWVVQVLTTAMAGGKDVKSAVITLR